MRYFRSLVALLLVSFCINTNAGVAGLTFHSRANCGGFNETISWDLGVNRMLRTISQHWKNENDYAPDHVLDTGVQNTWRSAAIHTNEGYGGWIVTGAHYEFRNSINTFLKNTMANDCSIYNGWWDH